MKYKKALLLFMIFLLSVPLAAQEAESEADSLTMDSLTIFTAPAPVSMLRAKDTDNDHGHAVTLNWEPSADDGQGAGTVMSYEVFRWFPFQMDTLETVRSDLVNALQERRQSPDVTSDIRQRISDLRNQHENILGRLAEAHQSYPENGEWRQIGMAPSGSSEYQNTGSKEHLAQDFLPDNTDFYFRVDAVTADPAVRTSSDVAGPVQCYGQWFNTGRYPVFVAVIVFCFLTIFFVTRARMGADLYVRPLAGIEAVDDAIGRATEMGRPILYILGLGTAADVATIASFTILGRVSKRVAEYQTQLIVPTYDPIVMSVAQEVVKSSYMDAGRSDDYDEDIVHFVTQSQFAYVAAVNGIMLRELPATNVYMGKFFAESLIMAETGAVAGSIQIAGTDEIAQIPFFIVACDYTLIGEELYAASAYLGREPILLGSLKAQDWAKAAVIIFGLVGLITANFGWSAFVNLFKVID